LSGKDRVSLFCQLLLSYSENGYQTSIEQVDTFIRCFLKKMKAKDKDDLPLSKKEHGKSWWKKFSSSAPELTAREDKPEFISSIVHNASIATNLRHLAVLRNWHLGLVNTGTLLGAFVCIMYGAACPLY
jgi:hypothetical protein